jgi:hypothetical protein
MKTLDELTETLISLPVGVRSIIAEKLISSLDESIDDKDENYWIDLAEKRYYELKSNSDLSIDIEQVLDNLKRKIYS